MREIIKKELKKNIAAIRVSNSVGLMARKAWNVLLVNAYHDLLNKKEHEIPVSVLCDVTGCHSRNYKRLRQALQELQTTLVEWDLGKGATINGGWCPDWISMQMLGSVQIKKGRIYYTYPHEMPTYLHNPAVYQKISISQQRKFKTGYSLALWENCLRYMKVGSTGLADVEEWRELLGATAKTYDKFFLLNSKIIKPSIAEINKVSNIEITLKTERKGRKIIKIGFDVKEKKTKGLLSGDRLSELESTPEFKELTAYGIHKVKALKWLDKYGITYMREKLDFVKSQGKSGRVKKSLSGLLVKSVTEDYQSEDMIQKRLEQERQQKEALAKKEAEYQKNQQDQRDKLANKFTKAEIDKYLSKFTEEEAKKLLEQAKKESPMLSSMMTSLDSPMCLAFLLPKIPSYEINKEAYIKENLKL